MMAPPRGGGTPKKSGDEEDSVMRQLEINYGKLKTHRAGRSKGTILHKIFAKRVGTTLKLLFKQCYLSWEGGCESADTWMEGKWWSVLGSIEQLLLLSPPRRTRRYEV